MRGVALHAEKSIQRVRRDHTLVKRSWKSANIHNYLNHRICYTGLGSQQKTHLCNTIFIFKNALFKEIRVIDMISDFYPHNNLIK